MAQLQFKGKPFVQNYHMLVKYHQLIPQKNKSLTKEVSLKDNLILHGDNLAALKALMPQYAGKVKCIYIDPPYNTGTEGWAYNDNVTSPMMQEWLGKVVDRDDLTRHDKWLCMMTPRLKLLKELLRDDGVIMVSIDDNEVANLRLLMDEIFQEENFICQLTWEKGRKNDAKLFSAAHEYLVVYARSLARLREIKTVWREPKPGAREIWEEYSKLRNQIGDKDHLVEEELRRWYQQLPKSNPSKALSRYKHVDKFGPWRDRDISWPGGGGPRYDVPHPKTKKPCKVPERGWGFATSEAMQKQISLGLVVFREDHTEPPFRKAHLVPVEEELDAGEPLTERDDPEDALSIGMQVMPSVIYKQAQVSIKAFRRLMGAVNFENPKDSEILSRLIRYVTSDDKSALVLDSFSGSGTTAHAVLALNKEDRGNRKFILIECENYANNITAERVRRVIKGVPSTKDENVSKGLGGSFSYFELGEPIDVDRLLTGKNLPSYKDLARYLFYTATGEEFDEKALDPSKNFVGESKTHAIHLFYEPNLEKLKNLALTLDDARRLKAPKDKRLMVFAPTKYLDPEYLEQYRIDFVQLPYEIYKAFG